MTHKIPARTVKLGTVVVLVTQYRDQVLTWDEVDGWNMLTTVDAMDNVPGRARLFLVPGAVRKETPPKSDAGADTFRRWHARDVDLVGELRNLPDAFGERVGRALRIDYKSDKWRRKGKPVHYTHDFTEDDGRPPIVYTDNPKRPRGFVLTGGTMAITEAGIA